MGNKLVECFNMKIESEMRMIKFRIIQMEKYDIYAKAYEIDSKITIFEILKEMSEKMNKKQLQACLQKASLIDFLYDEWMKISDSRNNELETVLWLIVNESEEEVA